MVVLPLFCFLSTDKLINECAMKRTRTLFDFNFGKGRDRGMIKTKYRDTMRTTQDLRKKFLLSS